MGSPYGCSGYRIGAIIGVKASVALKFTRDDGYSDNGIFMEKADGEGGRISVYCYCWDALLGIQRI